MSIQDCLKLKRSLTDPDDRALFELEFADQLASGIPAEDAYRYAAELTMEGMLKERNDLAAELSEKGAVVKQVTIEQLLTPPRPQTMSLFDPRGSYAVPAKGEELSVKATHAAQYDLFNQPSGNDGTQRTQVADTFNTRYEQIEVGTFQSGMDHINNPGDWAHVVASIRKHAQETMVVAVTDDAGKILNIIRHSKGTKDGASVYPLDIIGAIAQTEGGTKFWLAHNHPSGVVEQSQADVRITERIAQSSKFMGAEFQGHVVVGDGVYSVVTSDENKHPEVTGVPIPPAVRKMKIPVTERIMRKRKLGDVPTLTSPVGALEYVKNLESDSGLLLLDNRNQPIGVIAFTPTEMGHLKDGVQIRRLLAAISLTNASAGMAFVKGNPSISDTVLTNIGNYLAKHSDFRHLDSFFTRADGDLVSYSAIGKDLGRSSGRVYSRRGMRTFYSALSRHFADVQVKSATADQWIKLFRKMPQKGIPQAEIDYSGVIDWLDTMGLDYGQIPKEWVTNIIEENEVDIREINLTGKATLRQSTWVQDRAQEILDDKILALINRERLAGLSPGDPYTMDSDDTGGWTAANTIALEKYGEWVDKRHKEILDNPSKALVLKGLHVKQVDNGYRDYDWGVYNAIGDLVDGSYATEEDARDAMNATDYETDLAEFDMPDFTIERALDEAVLEAVENEEMMVRHEVGNRITRGKYSDYQEIVVEHVNPNYESIPGKETHFPFPNQVGWIRFSVRDTARGKTMLIEEIQDDIRQKGRRIGEALKKLGDNSGGFETAATVANQKKAKANVADLRDEFEQNRISALAALDKYDALGFDNVNVALTNVFAHPDWQQRWDMDPADHPQVSAMANDVRVIERAKTSFAAYRDAMMGYEENTKVPNVPFQKNWPLVLMKAAVRWAAKNGMNEVAWTGGKIQADRYGQIIEIEDLAYRKIGKLWDVWGVGSGMDTHESSGMDEKQLREQFGDEITERILSKEGQVNQFPEHVLTQAMAGGMEEADARAAIELLMKQATSFGPPGPENDAIAKAWRDLDMAVGIAEADLMGHYEVQLDERDGIEPGKWLIYDVARQQVIEAGFDSQGTAAQRLHNMKPNIWIGQQGLFEEDIAPGYYVFRDDERIEGPFEAMYQANLAESKYVPTDLNEVFHDTDYNYYKLMGVNLEIGGKGLKGFYDTMLPSMAGKWLKKFGVTPRKNDLGLTGRPDMTNWKAVARGEAEPERFNEVIRELRRRLVEDAYYSQEEMDNFEDATVGRRATTEANLNGFDPVEEESDPDGNFWVFELTDKLKEAAMGGFPMWKKGKKAAPTSKARVEKWLKGPIKRLRKDIEVEIVENVDELMARSGQRDIPADVDGMFHEGKAWIVAANITDKRDAERVLAHEAIGHLGIQKVLGPVRYAALRKKVMAMKASAMFDPDPDNELNQILDVLRTDYVDEFGEYTLNANQEADEIIAKIAERKPRLGRLREIWNTLVTMIRNWLASKSLYSTDRDIAYIESLLNQAVTGVTRDRRKNQRAADIQTESAYSREGGVTPAARARAGLQAMVAAQPDMFAYPRSDAKSMEEIFAEVSAGSIEITEDSKEAVIAMRLDDTPEEQRAERSWSGRMTLYSETGDAYGKRDFVVSQAGDNVWIDVSLISPGKSGSLIYAAVANYAYNNNKVFIGDPVGLSISAFHRRLENMISTALKFGTTRHIFPHPKQTGQKHWAAGSRTDRPLTPEQLDRVSPVTTGYLDDWQVGNHDHNIEQMLTLSYNNAYEFIRGQSAQDEQYLGSDTGWAEREDIAPLASYRFDPGTKQFRSQSTGDLLTNDDIFRLAKTPGSREINAGSNTIKRALLIGHFIENQGMGGRKIAEWLAEYANEPLPEQLKGSLYSRKGPLGANQQKGDLSIVKKQWPEAHAAAMSAMKRMDPAERKLLQGNLKKHKGTGWAASAVKSLVIRDIFNSLITGQDVEALMSHEFWGGDPIARFDKMISALKRGPAGVERLAMFYNFIGANRKAENDISSSYLACDPSTACAMFCYAVKGLGGTHVQLMKSEFTELASKMFPEVVMKNVVESFSGSHAGMSNLSLRINDKGDLSEAQVNLIKMLNQEGMFLQIFSKRPERLRQLNDQNLKMLSIDETNYNLALENSDLQLAVTLTDNFTEEMVDAINDRVAVYLPVNLKGTVWTPAMLKAKWPKTYKSMTKAMCPVEAGNATTSHGLSFVDVLAGRGGGSWVCTACDILGANGCFNGKNQTKNRRAALGLFEIEVNEAQVAADRALDMAEAQILKLQATGALSGEHAERALAGLREAGRVVQSESIPDPEATGSKGSDKKKPSYSRRGGSNRGDAPGQTQIGFDDLWAPESTSISRKDLGHKEASKRIPEIQAAMAGIIDGTTSRSEYDAAVNKNKPVEAYSYVPVPATRSEMESALASNKVDKIGAPARDLAVGDPVGLRLDIPAYTNHGVWVVSVHRQRGTYDAGKVVGYDSVARVKNATFGSNEKVSQKIAAGGPKSTIAVIKGDWLSTDEQEAQALAESVLTDPSWTQVGFDPERHSYFYDRQSMKPVAAADEVVQIGPLVMARNPQYASDSGFLYSRRRQTEPELAAHDRIGAAIRDVIQNGTTLAKEQGWGLLSVRQIAEQVYHILPSIHDEYVANINRMETVKNRFKDRAGVIASGRRKALNDKRNDQLSRMQHEATIAGVDPDVPYQPIIIAQEADERIRILNQRIYGRPGSDKSKLIEEVKHIKMLLGQEVNRKKVRSKVEDMWERMDPEQKSVYRAERDFHTSLREAQQNALLERIMDAQVDEAVKSGIMDKLRAQFEADSVHAPYFPLARFGKYFALSEQDGEPYYDMFENIGEWNRHKRDVTSDGGKILGAGKIMEQDYSKLDVDPEFVGQVDQLVASLGHHEKVTEIRDEIYQLYLQALPELSSRKHAIHRSKIRGFYMDHLRAFANTAQHGANMLGRLKFGHKMQATLDEAKKATSMAQYPSNYAEVENELDALREYLSDDIGEMTDREIRQEIKNARDAEDDDLLRKWQMMRDIKHSTEQIRTEPGQAAPYLPDVIQNRIERREKLLEMADRIIQYDKSLTDEGGSTTEHVLDEIGKSQDAIMNPNVSAWASNLNAVGFVWYLGFSLGAGVVNMTQTFAIGLPVLGAKLGWKQSAAHLASISAQVAAARKKNPDAKTFIGVEKLLQNADEKAAYKRWHDEGLLNDTLAHDLQGISDAGINTGQFKHKFMNTMAWVFHHAERLNREITALSAYRAAIEKGQSPREAAITAELLTWKTHFDYGQNNRARFMRGNWMRVITQFKQYSQNITYLYVSELKKSVERMAPHLSKEERWEAKKTLYGMLGMQSIFAGTLGLPLASVFIWIAEALFDDDDDDPREFEAEYRQFLKDTVGQKAGQFIAKGAVDAFTPFSMHGRLTMSDLWLRTSDRELEGAAGALDLTKAIFGPQMSIGTGIYRGVEQMKRGQYWRGFETMAPKWARDPMKAARYTAEDAKTLAGIDIKDMSAAEITSTLIGLSSSDLSEIYDQTGAVRNIEARRRQRRRLLMDKVVQESESGATNLSKELVAELEAWSKKNPRNPIDGSSIQAALQSRANVENQMVYGVRRTQANTDLLDRFNFAE